MTWLRFVNYYILQWFCIRLAKVVDTDGPHKGKITGWQILYPIHPISGWRNEYRYLWGNGMRWVTLWRRRN